MSIVQCRLSMLWKTRIHFNCAWWCVFWLDPNFRKSYCKTCSDALELHISALTYIGQHVRARNSGTDKNCTRTVCASEPAKSVQHRRAPPLSYWFRLETTCFIIPLRSPSIEIRAGSRNVDFASLVGGLTGQNKLVVIFSLQPQHNLQLHAWQQVYLTGSLA